MIRGSPSAAALLALIIAVSGASAQAAPQPTFANPVDIDYRYNFEQHNEGISYRSGADPVIVVQRGEYYLFETIGEGYWRSRDLGTWQHITPSRWPLRDIVAPAALSVRDTIYLLPSTTRPLPILMLTEPATGRVEFYNRLLPWLPMARDRELGVFAKPDSVQPGPWDPQFFHDSDTDRWFLYWNSSNVYPLHVIELDKTKRLAYTLRESAGRDSVPARARRQSLRWPARRLTLAPQVLENPIDHRALEMNATIRISPAHWGQRRGSTS